jgi:hypothetical protein
MAKELWPFECLNPKCDTNRFEALVPIIRIQTKDRGTVHGNPVPDPNYEETCPACGLGQVRPLTGPQI